MIVKFFTHQVPLCKKKNDYKYYINSKLKTERFIKSLKNKNIKFLRLPQFKTSQTYNLFGNYRGININNLKKFIKKFLNS